MTVHYTYEHDATAFGKVNTPHIPTLSLDKKDNAGHADHWAIVTDSPSDDLPKWLNQSLETASVPNALGNCKASSDYLLIGGHDSCHIKQIFALTDGKPAQIINIFPSVNSPYGLPCTIQEIIACQDSQDAILRLDFQGTTIYAFDTLYAINQGCYKPNTTYYVNFSAWAYDFAKSNQAQTVVVDDPKAIRYHRAFNDVVAKNDGQIPDDIETQIKTQIKQWQESGNDNLDPIEINLGHSCIYLFGETFGQQDDAWCQGQVLGKSTSYFFGKDITLFDVVILREQDNKPFVVRIATPTTTSTNSIAVHDYIQANIWLQASIYQENQH